MRGTTLQLEPATGESLLFTAVIGNDDGTANAAPTVAMTGAGTATLAANSPLAGEATVSAGTLNINGTYGSNVSVTAGTLGGTGTIEGDLNSTGGVVSPGTN
ncbi:MAG: hypothetical protein MPN21_16900 [Thermoanaerobaculia bacterium]|nr:hypothetical protein [Thermoanaerobaculia bacterium]